MNARLEAFCDAVFAFGLTLLIIDVRLPSMEEIHSRAALWTALRGLGPATFAVLLSFDVILISWVNHRNTLALVRGGSSRGRQPASGISSHLRSWMAKFIH
jgi:uncharacterized membrane protein